jgi:hypothetical protein
MAGSRSRNQYKTLLFSVLFPSLDGLFVPNDSSMRRAWFPHKGVETSIRFRESLLASFWRLSFFFQGLKSRLCNPYRSLSHTWPAFYQSALCDVYGFPVNCGLLASNFFSRLSLVLRSTNAAGNIFIEIRAIVFFSVLLLNEVDELLIDVWQ